MLKSLAFSTLEVYALGKKARHDGNPIVGLLLAVFVARDNENARSSSARQGHHGVLKFNMPGILRSCGARSADDFLARSFVAPFGGASPAGSHIPAGAEKAKTAQIGLSWLLVNRMCATRTTQETCSIIVHSKFSCQQNFFPICFTTNYVLVP